MLAALVRALALACRVHVAWPGADMGLVGAASWAAVRAETPEAPAELLVAIAQHESDLQPRAVSWVADNSQRVDRLWIDEASRPPPRGQLACGLVSTIASTRDGCAVLLDPDEAMRAGARELAEHRGLCRRSLRCALSSYAGGRRGIEAWRAGRRTSATIFADLFIRRAEQLGMGAPTS